MKTLFLFLLLALPAFAQIGKDHIRQGRTSTSRPGILSIAASDLFSEDVLPIVKTGLREQDKQALRDLKAIYEKAIAEKDLELIKPHLAEDFSAVMITADEVKDYDGIKAYWKKVEEFIGEGGTYTVSVEPDDTIFDGNIAIAKGIAKEHVVRGGKVIDLTTRWTAIARKEGDAWKLVRIQASIDPVNNPIISALNKGKLWVTGGVAGVVGLLVGFLLGRRSRRVAAP